MATTADMETTTESKKNAVRQLSYSCKINIIHIRQGTNGTTETATAVTETTAEGNNFSNKTVSLMGNYNG